MTKVTGILKKTVFIKEKEYYYSVRQLSDLTGISVQGIQKAIKKGREIVYIKRSEKVGNTWMLVANVEIPQKTLTSLDPSKN